MEKVFKNQLAKMIHEKELAQLEEESTYSFFSDFVYKNNLEEKFVEFLRKEQKEYEENNITERVDYDHIAMDFV
ncbi:hypothetical protein [Paraliobacillus sp. X-1268]|uniref:hypothetical protein n=1 Tax=Paraliobacillus sp. X-1268 TaxID=2213193 RepID=UPI000E3D5707|nr:hypothetical protein [Paraliobacillus sp. X-1268]